MELVASGLRDHFHIGAGIPSEPRIVHRCLDLEFFDGIRVGDGNAPLLREVASPAAAEVVDIRAVHGEIVADVAGAVHVDIDRAAAQLRSVIHVSRDTWRKGKNLRVVALGERQGLNGRAFDRSAERRIFSLQSRGRGHYLNRFLLLAWRQRQIHRAGFCNRDRDVFRYAGLEAIRREAQRIRAGGKQIETVIPGLVGRGGGLCSGCPRGQSNARPGDHRSPDIREPPGNRTRRLGLG